MIFLLADDDCACAVPDVYIQQLGGNLCYSYFCASVDVKHKQPVVPYY